MISRPTNQTLTSETGGEGARRVKGNQPESSLILLKPTLQLDHEGGRRFAKESWHYYVLLRWIEAGAKPVSSPARLERLQIEPATVLMREPGQSQSLRVVARWEDGTAEDVTCLCRFSSGDDSIAAVDADGKIKAMGRGDTHVVAFYDNGVATVPVVLPVTDRVAPKYLEVAARTKIDELVVAKLKTLGVVPSEVCGDADFLRRASIDLTGTLPTPDEIEAFLADRSPDKRARKIDELLNSPAYAAWWANRLCDITGNNPFHQSEGRTGHQLSVQWYSWIHCRVAENTPYDQIAAGIVLASGRRDKQQPYDEYAREMSSYLDKNSEADFSARQTLPHYWTRRNVETPDDKALAVAHSFLGLRLQCAQCHKHPHDRWTQNDFQQFTRFFAALEFGVPAAAKGDFDRLARATGQPTGGNNAGNVTQEAAALADEGRTIAWRELYFNPARGPQGRLNLLGESVAAAKDEDPRTALMAWMRRPDNPYFARAFVNRVWANCIHAGLIEQVDDLNLANPPSNRELLD